jgi:acrylyl-CoA reductase (NADPH)
LIEEKSDSDVIRIVRFTKLPSKKCKKWHRMSSRRVNVLHRQLVGSPTSGSDPTAACDQFKAIVVDADRKGKLITNAMQTFGSLSSLPRQDDHGEVTIRVSFSTLNYKDEMILKGMKGVVPEYPIMPGIDAAGEVVSSDDAAFVVGDRVVVTGNKIGQHFDGGYSQFLRVKSKWVVKVPSQFTLEETMVIGTAGFTAMQCVLHLEDAGDLSPQNGGEVLVTGAAGGVGSMAVAILARRGYKVVASSGRADSLRSYFQELGASRTIGRMAHNPKRPLGDQLWAGVVDAVGSGTLAACISQTVYRGAVASAGVAGGGDLPTSVYPFILRGVRLLGVDSTLPHNVVGYPSDERTQTAFLEERLRTWRALASDLDSRTLGLMHEGTIGLTDVVAWSDRILNGEVRGRVVVNVDR